MNDPYQVHIPAYWAYAQKLRDQGIVGDEFNKAMVDWHKRHPEDQPGAMAAAQIARAHARNLKTMKEMGIEEEKQ